MALARGSSILRCMVSGTNPTGGAVFRFVDVCPGCGYSLEGLADEGVCPECGRSYDQRTLILYGAARGAHGDLSNAGPGQFAFVGVVGAAFFLYAWDITNLIE